MIDDRYPLRLSKGDSQGHAVRDDIISIHLFKGKIELIGLDPGQIKNLVDEIKKVVPPGQNALDVLVLGR